MKPLVPTAFAAAALLALPAAAQPGPQPRMKQLQVTPPAGFVVGKADRQGTNQVVEWVPRGETVQRYTKIIRLNSFVARPGTAPGAVMGTFVERYKAMCARASAVPMVLGGGASGVRVDCPRHPRTGRPETVFARAISVAPAIAVVQYSNPYFTMPGEAAQARDFLGRVGVR